MEVSSLLPYHRQLAMCLGIGNTPLFQLPAPNGCRIFAKGEYSNAGGSHYDRVFIHLLSAAEQEGKIKPGITTLTEVTSGSAGISLALLAKELGYACRVYAPNIIPAVRLERITEQGAEVFVTGSEHYVGSAAAVQAELLKSRVKDKVDGIRRLYGPDHSRKKLSAWAVEPIVDEAAMQSDCLFDAFIGPSGNGTTVNGIGGRLRQLNPKARVVVIDPEEAQAALWIKHGQPAGVHARPHGLFGAGGYGISFPMLEMAVNSGLITDFTAIKKEEYEREAANLLGMGHSVGRTSAAAYFVAKAYCQENPGQNVLIVFYDLAEGRY